MGNTGSNFATGARSVSDSKYDYFYSRDKGGICRAANDGSGMDVLQPLASDASCTIRNLNLNGDTLIYQSVVLDSSASSCIGTIHALKTDGTEDQEIWKAADAGSIYGVYLYDSKVYVLVYSHNGSSSQSNPCYEIWTMDEDGSNQRMAGTFPSSDISCQFVTLSKVYFFQSDGSSRDCKTVNVQNFDGSGKQVLYTTSNGYRIQKLFVTDGKIYIDELNEGTEEVQVICMNADGSGASSVYSENENGEDIIDLNAVSHGSLYMIRYKKSFELAGEKVPLDGSSATEIQVPLDYDEYVTIDEAGDHLLVLGNDAEAGAVSAYTIYFEGNKLRDYVTSGYYACSLPG